MVAKKENGLNNKPIEELIADIEDVIKDQADDDLFTALTSVLGTVGYTSGVEKKLFVSFVVDAVSSIYEAYAEENK